MMNSKKILAFYLFFLIFSLSCSPTDPAEKYIGEWENIKSSSRFAKIYKVGDSYVWEDNEGKYPASFKDRKLKVSSPFGELDVLYLEESDHIIIAGDEFRRIPSSHN